MADKYIDTAKPPPGLQKTTQVLPPAVLSRIAGIFYSTLFDILYSSRHLCKFFTWYACAFWRAHFLFSQQFHHFRHSGTPLIFHCRGPPLVKFGRQPNFTKRRKFTMSFNKDDYGSRIRSLRKNRGLTQEQLAEKLNVSTPYICQQVRSFRTTGLWRMWNPISSLYLVQAGQEACGMAMCQPPGLRHEVLPPLPYPGRRASPASHPRRHQLRHEPKDFPHPPNYISHGIRAGSCPWPEYESCRH